MQTKKKVPNAQKWTEERVIEILADIKQDALSEDIDYLGIALVRQGLYKQIWSYWKSAFAEHELIAGEIMAIEYIFESRLVHAALHKKVSPWMAIFALKCNYHWSQKQETEQMNADRHRPSLTVSREPDDCTHHAEEAANS